MLVDCRNLWLAEIGLMMSKQAPWTCRGSLQDQKSIQRPLSGSAPGCGDNRQAKGSVSLFDIRLIACEWCQVVVRAWFCNYLIIIEIQQTLIDLLLYHLSMSKKYPPKSVNLSDFTCKSGCAWMSGWVFQVYKGNYHNNKIDFSSIGCGLKSGYVWS